MSTTDLTAAEIHAKKSAEALLLNNRSRTPEAGVGQTSEHIIPDINENVNKKTDERVTRAQ